MHRVKNSLIFIFLAMGLILSACGEVTASADTAVNAATNTVIPAVTDNSVVTTVAPTSPTAATAIASGIASATNPTATAVVAAATIANNRAKPTKAATATTPKDNGLKMYEVLPKITDGAIDDWLDPHIVTINRTVPDKQKLFVFLSGSNGKPANQELILQQAADSGYHAIGLRYPNSWTVGQLCQRDTDPACYEEVRLEILDGQDRTDLVKVNQANSIENRLMKLLTYLKAQYPDDGWGAYLDGNGTSPKWSDLMVAGHSQGGGHAAMIAREHAVARVIMFASPDDYSRKLKAPAPWLATPHATPIENYYSFGHTKDPGADEQKQAWAALGMNSTGPAVNVDGKSPPYNNSHQLLTAANPAQSNEFHGSVVVDRNTPKLADGSPVFKEVWQYLCFP